MKDFLTYLVSLLVTHKDEISVEERPFGDTMTSYIVKTNTEDTGKIIGREGKIIQAIRNVAKILAVKEGKQIRIEIG